MLEFIFVYIALVILNYIAISYMTFVIFKALEGKDERVFFERVVGKSPDDFTAWLQLFIVLPFIGVIISGVFLYKYHSYLEQGNSEYYSLFLVFKREK